MSLTFAPTLHFKDGRKDEKLADWGSREKASAFVEWLWEKTGMQARR